MQILNNLPKLLKILNNKQSYEHLYKNHFFITKLSSSKKSYQIKITSNHVSLLEECKNKCGLNYSQITELCYQISYDNEILSITNR